MYRRSYELNHDFLADYSRNFIDDKLSLAAIAGVNINERYATAMVGQADKLTFETGFWDLSNGSSWTSLSESQSKRRQVAAFADLTLGWDDMLYLNVTGRNEWSSTLPISANSYFYPGATLSWIFTKLLPKNDVFTFGKARIAYGKTGNDASPYLTSPASSRDMPTVSTWAASSASPSTRLMRSRALQLPVLTRSSPR